MRFRLLYQVVIGLVVISSGLAQERIHVSDQQLGIAFDAPAPPRKVDAISYEIAPQAADPSSSIRVSVSNRLFVDLEGSYGGRLYTDAPSARLNDRMVIDSTQGFSREYWVVYAGMGMWDGVINCYKHEGGRYYIVSLARHIQLGKPGEEVNGMPLDGEALKERLLTSLRDSTRTEVRQFDALVSSVEVLNQ